MSQFRDQRDQMELDPVGFLTQAMPAEDVELAALSLITDPNVWANVSEVIKGLLESPDKLELARSRLKNMTYERRDSVAQRRETRRAAERNAREVKGFITNLIPDGMADHDAQQFYDAALTEVRDFAIRMNAETIEVKYLPALIAHVARQYGLDPFASNGGTNGDGKVTPAAPPARPKVGVAAPAGSRTTVPTGEALAEAARKKAALQGVPPGGLPSSESEAPPAQQTVKERIAYLRGRR
jgi:hypothetical protein